MTEYLITIPGDEAVRDARTEDDRRAVGEAHRARRSQGGTPQGPGTLVTDGPDAEAPEQVGWFYPVESDDLDDLLAVIRELVATEPVVEIRPLVRRTSGIPA